MEQFTVAEVPHEITGNSYWHVMYPDWLASAYGQSYQSRWNKESSAQAQAAFLNTYLGK